MSGLTKILRCFLEKGSISFLILVLALNTAVHAETADTKAPSMKDYAKNHGYKIGAALTPNPSDIPFRPQSCTTLESADGVDVMACDHDQSRFFCFYKNTGDIIAQWDKAQNNDTKALLTECMAKRDAADADPQAYVPTAAQCRITQLCNETIRIDCQQDDWYLQNAYSGKIWQICNSACPIQGEKVTCTESCVVPYALSSCQ